MNFRRKYTRRVKRSYRKKTYRKMLKRSMYGMRQNLVSIKRSFVTSPFTLTSSWAGVYFNFALSALPNYTEFTNLFEQYRINGVKLTFIPSGDSLDFNQQQANSGAGYQWGSMPRVYTAIDKDGNAQYASENAILQYGNHRIISSPLKPFSIYIKHPNVQFGTANLVTIVGGAPKAKQWLDCDNYNVQHWGAVIGGIIPYATVSATISYQVVATYYMQFKNAV